MEDHDRLLQVKGRGRIINVSPAASVFAPIPMVSAYVVSKTALYWLSENLAAETCGHGVMVFAIDPGLLHTAMSEAGCPSANPGSSSSPTPSRARRTSPAAPSGRRKPMAETVHRGRRNQPGT